MPTTATTAPAAPARPFAVDTALYVLQAERGNWERRLSRALAVIRDIRSHGEAFPDQLHDVQTKAIIIESQVAALDTEINRLANPEPQLTQQALASALCEVYDHDDHPGGCTFMMGRAARILELLDEGGAR